VKRQFFTCILFFSILSTLYTDPRVISTGTIDYAITWDKGVSASLDGGNSWEPRSEGLAQKTIYPFTETLYQPITSLSYDSSNHLRVAVTTKKGLFLSDNGGKTWSPIPISLPLKSTMVFTSCAVSPRDPDKILLGTSFSGFFESRDKGKSWVRLSNPEHPDYKGAGFFEEIQTISYDDETDDVIYIENGFNSGKFIYKNGALSPLNQENQGESEKQNIDTEYSFQKTAMDKFGIYLNGISASGESLTAHLDFLEEKGLNSLVIDMKDDRGNITYNSELDMPKEIGALKAWFSLEDLLEEAHKHGIYVIARIVVFQDPKLYAFQENKYAVWMSSDTGPWGNIFEITDSETGETSFDQREFWVDPYCADVWDYNISIAEELEEKGVDEIQFDYIRFPTDGDLSLIKYRFRKPGMSKTDAIESFLKIAAERITIPISIDIYGFNGWYRMGNWNGQDIEIIARYADVICPMLYPSHFPRNFLKEIPYLERAEILYKRGTMRAQSIVEGRALIRPFVQAFLIGNELAFDEPDYWEYLVKQLNGVVSAGNPGFTLWNSSNRYYMVIASLNDFTNRNSGYN